VKQASHKKTNTVYKYLYEVLRVVKFIETEIRMVVARGWGEGGMGHYYLIGTEFQFYKMKSVLEMVSGDGSTMRMCLIPLNCTLENG